eukprot:9992123-Alexandrium_andersonii.AAC.1
MCIRDSSDLRASGFQSLAAVSVGQPASAATAAFSAAAAAAPGGCLGGPRAYASTRPSTSARRPSSGGSTWMAGAAASGLPCRPFAQACAAPSTR